MDMAAKRKGILSAIILLAALLIAAACVFSWNYQGENDYNRQISLAGRYYSAGDYEKAVLTYQHAIRLEPEREEGYVGLVQVYSAQGNDVMAGSVLKIGAEKTGSIQLTTMLQKMLDEGGEESSHPEPDGISPALNTTLLNSLRVTTYNEYRVRSSIESDTVAKDGSRVIRVKGFAGQLTYSPEDLDRASGKPKADCLPRLAALDNVLTLFHGQSVSYGELRLFGVERLQVKQDEARGYVVTFTAGGCDVSIASDSQGNISEGAWNEIVLPDTEEQEDVKDVCRVSGRILDAVTGEGVAGVRLKVREGSRRSGDEITAVQSDSSGQYELSLNPGAYTAEVSCDGYGTEYFELEVGTEQEMDIGSFVISPTLNEGQVRIVLEWGAEPRDLDSYLVGNLDDGTRVYTYFFSRISSRNGEKAAELDVDDRDGYGPETTTIYDINGTFSFYVEDFTHTGTMSSSGATVKIYTPEQAEPVIVEICEGLQNIWYVCEIDHGQVSVTNHG